MKSYREREEEMERESEERGRDIKPYKWDGDSQSAKMNNNTFVCFDKYFTRDGKMFVTAKHCHKHFICFFSECLEYLRYFLSSDFSSSRETKMSATVTYSS